jgi:Rod binding domain-containing protein
VSSLPVTSPLAGAITPVGVRTDTKTEKASAQTAMAFERVLLGELTKAIADPQLVSGGQPTSGATSMMMSQLPDVLADSLSQSGGIGLAAALQPALQGVRK